MRNDLHGIFSYKRRERERNDIGGKYRHGSLGGFGVGSQLGFLNTDTIVGVGILLPRLCGAWSGTGFGLFTGCFCPGCGSGMGQAEEWGWKMGREGCGRSREGGDCINVCIYMCV